jgi:hypothetical protein
VIEPNDGAPKDKRGYRQDEVDALTQRANSLLDELHDVMEEMTQRLRALQGGER